MIAVANGVRLSMRSIVLGFVIGCGVSTTFGVWLTYFRIVPGLQHEDQVMREDFNALVRRFEAMALRFDALAVEEQKETAHNATMQTTEAVSSALVTELSNHVHAQDGRLDSHETRMQQLQGEMTRLRSDFDGLASASGRRR